MATGLPRIAWNNSLIEGLAVGDFSASSTASGFPPVNVRNRREYVSWKTSATGAQWLEFDFGAPVQIQFLGIAGHNLNAAGVTNVNLTADNVGGGAPLANVVVPNFTPGSNRALGEFFTPATWQHWSLGMNVPSGAEAEIGVVFLCGSFLEFESLVNSGFDPDRFNSFFNETIGDAGHLLGVVEKFKQKDFTANFNWLTPSFVANDFLPFMHANGRKPFFWIWEHVTHANAVDYVRVTSNPVSTPYDEVWRSVSINMQGLFDAL